MENKIVYWTMKKLSEHELISLFEEEKYFRNGNLSNASTSIAIDIKKNTNEEGIDIGLDSIFTEAMKMLATRYIESIKKTKKDIKDV